MEQEIKTINIPVEVLGLQDIKIKSVKINRQLIASFVLNFALGKRAFLRRKGSENLRG